MPSQTTNKGNILANGHQVFCYMSVYVPQVVWSGTISTEVNTRNLHGLISITISGTDSGSYTNVRSGMKVEVKTASGKSKGFTRVRYGTFVTSALGFKIREWDRGQVAFDTGDKFYVYDEIPISDKLVVAKKTFAPDNMDFATYGEFPYPMPCSGGHWAGWDWMLPLPFEGDTSYTTDPDSGGSVTHDWDIPSGLTITTGTSSSANIEVDGTQGSYSIQHSVTDDDNSQTVIQDVYAIVHDDTHPPYDVLIESPQGNEEKGYSTKVTMMSVVPISVIPDGAHVILWKEEYMANSLHSYGQRIASRSHIIMDGIIRHEDGSMNGKDRAETLSFDVISPMARLEEIVGYSKAMIRNQTPDAWGDVKSLTTQRAATQIWQMYTNMSEAGYDFTFTDDYKIFNYPKYYIQKSNPVGQLREIADGVDARFVCDRSGHFECHTRPELIAITDRGSATVTMTLDEDDIASYEYSREHWRPVELLECRGFTDGTTDEAVSPVFSRWPGLAPGLGTDSPIVERLICDTQTDLNERCGRRGASADGIYTDANGAIQMSIELSLVLRGSYDVFEFYNEFIQVNVITRKRQIDFSTFLFVLQSTQIDYEGGTAKTTIKLRSATNGVSGETYIPPESLTNIPTYPSPDTNFPTTGTPPPAPPVFPNGTPPTGKLFGIEVQHGKAFATVTSGATWFLVGSGTITGTMIDTCSDPFNYGVKYITTTDGLWRVADPYGDPTTATLVATEDVITGTSGVWPMRIQMSINRKGYIIIAFGWHSVAVSTNYGATWNQYAVISSVETINPFTMAQRGLQHPIALSQNNNPGSANQGWVYSVQVHDLGGGVFKHNLYLSKDWGVTWTLAALDIDASNGDASRQIHIPYKKPGGSENTNNTSQVTFYYRTGFLYLVTAGGASVAKDGSTPRFRNANYYGLNSYTFNGNNLAAVASGTGAIAGPSRFYTSVDAGASWTDHGAFSPFGNNTIVGVNGWSDLVNFVMWAGASIYITENGGATFSDISGNLATLIGFDFNVLYCSFDLVDVIIPS